MGRNRILYEGILVGLAGAAAVAIWFFVYDLALATPFRTPALLGAVLFEGLRDPAALTITPGIVLKYTVVHGLAFLVFGMAASAVNFDGAQHRENGLATTVFAFDFDRDHADIRIGSVIERFDRRFRIERIVPDHGLGHCDVFDAKDRPASIPTPRDHSHEALHRHRADA